MANAKKRVARRKKASKSGRARAEPARKKAAKRARRPPKTVAKMAPRNQAKKEILTSRVSDEALETAAGEKTLGETPPVTWHYGFCC